MPAPINPPRIHRPSMRLIAQLSETEFEAVQATISGSLLAGERSETNAMLRKALKGRNGSRRLLEAVTGAQSMAESRGLSPHDAAERIAASPELDLQPDEQESLSNRLASLLGMREIVLLSRALLIYSESGERRYCKSRAFSELVPVFGGSESVEVEAAFIKHTLRIDYHTKTVSETETFFLTMDDRTVKDLHAVLSREIAKSEVLKQSSSAAGLRLVQIEVDH